MQVFASWKELYGSFTTASTPLSAIGGFAHCLADGDTAEMCQNQLCGTPDGVLLVPMNDGHVHLLHQFHMDVQTPAVPAGTGELWALLGHGADALPVKIPDSLFTVINGEVLRLPTLLDATDKDGVIRVSTINTRSGMDIYKGLRCVLLPPVLGHAAMSADSDDPWEIFTSIRKAAVDFDIGTATGNRGPTSGAVEESKNDEMVLDDADKATFVFRHVLQLLCIVMEPSLPATGFPINVLTTSRPLEYARHRKQTHGIDFVPPALGSPGPGTPDTIPQSPQFTAILDAHRNSISAVSQLTMQMTRSNLAMEKRNKKSTSKKGKGKFGAHTLRMALNATQPLPPDMMDEDGDMVTTWTELVTDYNEFLEQGTSGEARTFLGTLLNDKRQCNAHVPASTAIALFTGKLRWTNLEVPKAFSILSCFHMAFSSAVDDSSEAVQSALKVTKGDGLSAEDVEKATKIVHFVPRQFDHMTKMFAIMSALLGVALGDESDAAIACRSWLSHFRKHEMSYLAIARDEPDFYLRLCCHTDRCLQLYFEVCQSSESPADVSRSWLSFDSLQNLILTKRHNLPLAPPKLQAQFFKKRAAVDIELPAGTGGGQDAKKRKAGKPVVNESLNSTWKIPKRQLSAVLRKVHGMPMLGGNQRICLKYHMVGECNDECPHKQSHSGLPGLITQQFDQWARQTKLELDIA